MQHKIYVGTFLKLKTGFMQMEGSSKIMYCGMSNENTFVVTPLVHVGYQGFSPSIYYDISSKIVHMYDREFDVIEVTPMYIILGI